MLVLWVAVLGTLHCVWEDAGSALPGYEEVVGSCVECEDCMDVDAGKEECATACSDMGGCFYSTWEDDRCVLAADCLLWGGNGTTWAKVIAGFSRTDTSCRESGEAFPNRTLLQCHSECTLRQTCSSFMWYPNATISCVHYETCTPTSDTGYVRYDKIQSVVHESHQTDTSWEDSHAYCAANNSRLCTLSEICSEIVNQPFEGSRWAPVGSMHNGWVQIGDVGGCQKVEVFTQDEWEADSFYEDVFCCKAADCRVPGSVVGSSGTQVSANDSLSCREACIADPHCQWNTYSPLSKACNLTYHVPNGTTTFIPNPYVVTSPRTCELAHVCRNVTPAPDTLAPLNPIPPPIPPVATPAPPSSGNGLPLLPLLIAMPVVVVVLGLGVVAWKIRPTMAGRVSGRTRKSISDIVQEGDATEMEPKGPERRSCVSPKIEILGPNGEPAFLPDLQSPGKGETALLQPPPTPSFSDFSPNKGRGPASPMAGFVEIDSPAKGKKKKKRRKSNQSAKTHTTTDDNMDTDTSALTDHDV